jgi:hypothetical protein
VKGGFDVSGRAAGAPNRLAVAAIAILVLGVGCDGSEPTSRPSASLSIPSMGPPSPLPPSAIESPAPSAPALEDGRHFGYIRSIEMADLPGTLVFDLAEFFRGEAANEAAREDGVIGKGESVPNDYYIRNRNPQLRTVAFEADVRITVVDWDHCCEEIRGDLALFVAAFEEDDPAGTYQGPRSPYMITVAGGVVVEIEEQFLP